MNRLAYCIVFSCLTGCTFVYTEKDIAGAKEEFATFEPRLIGDWELKDPDSITNHPGDPSAVGGFTRIERKSPDSKVLLARQFTLVKPADGGPPIEKEEANDAAAARFVKIGDLHLISGEEKTPGRFQILKVDWTNDGFAISFMSTEFFERHPKLIAHRKDKSGVIITADVESIHDFLKTNGKRADLWVQFDHPLALKKRSVPAKK
jgi:hypothetical protein